MTASRSGDAATGDTATTDTDPASPIRVEDVSVAYGDVPVLEGVSLSVGAGELVGLVGPNGAGKTTLLKTVTGILDPDAGSAAVAGDDVADLSSREASRRVATVPQTATVAFDFSVEDVVAMGRTPYHGRFSSDPDAAAAIERALDRTDTTRFRDRAIDSLSGGERQRVLLARALAQETPALLLDEPTANLDVNHQVGTLELVRDLVDTEGTAVLAAIHDLDLAARFCDRLALLADGSLRAVGTPDRVLREGPLAAAFETDAAVLPNPVTGTPTVTPVAAGESRPETCHVVGTGHPAARAVAALVGAGFTVTAGAFPAGDVAAATARELADETVTAPPFVPVGGEAETAVRDCLDRADAVVRAGSVPEALDDVVAEFGVVTVEADDVREDVGESVDRKLSGPVTGPVDESAAETDGDTTADSLAERVRRAVEYPTEADD